MPEARDRMSAAVGMSARDVGGLFLHAPLDPGMWIKGLEALASATGSMRGQFLGVDGNGGLAFNFMTNVDDRFLTDFLELPDHHAAAGNYRVAASGEPGQVIWEDSYDAIRAARGPSAYDEMCEKHELPFGCQMAIAHDDRLLGLALLRSRRDGRSTAEQRDFFAAVAPDVRAAASLQIAIEGRACELTRGALDLVPAAMLLLDGFGRVMTITPAADRVLAATRRLDVRQGAVVASSAAQTRELNLMLGAVLHGRRSEASLLLRGGGEPALRLAIHALPRTEWDLGFSPRAAIVLNGGAPEPVGLGRTLQADFGLTQSEAEIAVGLASCTPRARIAEQRGTSIGTVRQQIKAIFGKLGVAREAEFTSLIGTIVGN